MNRDYLGRAWPFAIALSFLAAATVVRAQESPAVQLTPWVGERGIVETTAQIMERQRLADLTPAPPHPPKPVFRRTGQRPAMQVVQTSDSQNLNSSRPMGGPYVAQTTNLSFTGATLADTSSSFPPDSMGAAGPTQYLVTLNGRFRSFNKTTGIADGAFNVNPDVFFASVISPAPSGGFSFSSDPRVRFDRLSGRWFISMLDVSFDSSFNILPNNRFLIAVSSGGAISGTSSWTLFYFNEASPSPAGNTQAFADYDMLGIDANALYLGANMFDFVNSTLNTTGFVVRKSSLISGGPIVVSALRNLVDNNGTGPYSPQGVDNFTTNASEGYFIGVDFSSSSQLAIVRVLNPGGTPSISKTSVNVSLWNEPINVPHRGNAGGSAGNIEGLDSRLICAVIRGSNLWTCHNIGTDNVGGSGTVTRNGVSWYEIQNFASGSTPTLAQSGLVYQPSANNTTDQRSYWMGSIMVSGQGHMALGFSSAGSSEYINGATCGRLVGDAPGTTQPVILYTASTTPYNPSGDPGDPNQGRRWGDFSYTSLDPSDDMTLWTIQEYCNAVNSYGVRVVKLLAPSPAKPVSCSPSTINVGSSNVILTLTGQSSSGSGFFEPGANFTKHISAAINGGGVTVSSVNYNNPTNITMTVSVDPTANAGGRTVTVTNPDGQAATSLSSLVTILIPISLDIALNTTGRVWTTSGDAVWFGQTTTSHDGYASGQSGAISNGQTSVLNTVVSGPGTLKFWWKTSTQTNSDLLTFSVNGTQLASASGEVDWEQETLFLPPGNLNLQWAYTKDSSGSAGQDTVWLDQVEYVGGGVPPTITAQPADQLVVAGNSATFTGGADGTPPLSYQWLYNGSALAGATRSSLTLAPAWQTNAGNYSLQVTNIFGVVTSSVAVLSAVPIAAWGNNDFGQTIQSATVSNAVAIAVGAYHNLALRSDGTVVAWGDDFDGQTDVPAGLNNVAGIGAGGYHSLAVKSDGSVVAWGNNFNGQIDVPPQAVNVVAVAGGDWHSLALRADGTVVAWGDDSAGQTDVPPGLSNVVAIAAGGQHNLALRSDGTVLAWGTDVGPNGGIGGQIDVPVNLTNAIAVSAGSFHSLALKMDGTVVGWGDNSLGQITTPSGMTHAIGISAGGAHSLAIQQGGVVYAWGDNLYNQSIVSGVSVGVIAVAAGSYHSVALVGRQPAGPLLFGPTASGGVFGVSFASIRGKAYFLLYQNSLTDTLLHPVTAIVGDGGTRVLRDTGASAGFRLYKVQQQ